MLTIKLKERITPFVNAKNPGDENDRETIAFREKMHKEAEDLKIESFGVEVRCLSLYPFNRGMGDRNRGRAMSMFLGVLLRCPSVWLFVPPLCCGFLSDGLIAPWSCALPPVPCCLLRRSIIFALYALVAIPFYGSSTIIGRVPIVDPLTHSLAPYLYLHLLLIHRSYDAHTTRCECMHSIPCRSFIQ